MYQNMKDGISEMYGKVRLLQKDVESFEDEVYREINTVKNNEDIINEQ